MTPQQIRDKIVPVLSAYQKPCIGFSGGADSTLLLALAAAQGSVLAVTADGPMLPREDLKAACAFAAALPNVTHVVVPADVFSVPEFAANLKTRCYHCKKMIFGTVKDLAAAHGCDVIFDGANTDDLGDYRPGMRATAEIGVVSPFLKAGIRKADIYALSREMNLPTQDKPAAACLASRIPTGEAVTREKLEKIELGEKLLKTYGFTQLRLRLSGGTKGVVECAESEKVYFYLNYPQIREQLAALCIDVADAPRVYRQGAMN